MRLTNLSPSDAGEALNLREILYLREESVAARFGYLLVHKSRNERTAFALRSSTHFNMSHSIRDYIKLGDYEVFEKIILLK